MNKTTRIDPDTLVAFALRAGLSLAIGACAAEVGGGAEDDVGAAEEALSGPGVRALYGDGYVEWTSAAGSTFCGFSRRDADQNYNTIDYGLHVSGGTLFVYESGVSRGSFGAVATSDRLRVQVTGTTVAYQRNGVTVYTSTVPAVFPLLVDTAFYRSGDRISNVAFSAAGSAAVPITTWRRTRGVSIATSTITAIGPGSTGWGLHGASAGVGGINYAARSNGGTVFVSSTLDASHPASVINDGDRAGFGVAGLASGFWQAAPSAHCFDGSQWAYVSFGGARTISEVDVFSVQDGYAAPAEPTGTMPATRYGLLHFHVQYWTGSAWLDVPNGYVTWNYKVWRQVRFAPLTTSRVRVALECQHDDRGRIVEIEAWGDLPSCTSCSSSDSCSPDARCVDPSGLVTTCENFGVCDRGTCAATCGRLLVRDCATACTGGGGYSSTCGEMGYRCVGSLFDPPPSCSTCTALSACGQQCEAGGVSTTCGAEDSCTPCTSCTWESSADQQCLTLGETVSTCGVAGRSTNPVLIDITLTSGLRTLVYGYDGGHWWDDNCDLVDVPFAECAGHIGDGIDGLGLEPDANGAYAIGNPDLPVLDDASVRRIDGPFQMSNGKWEWENGTSYVYTHRRTDLIRLLFSEVDGGREYTGNMTFYWDEDDAWSNDDINWTGRVGRWINDCLAASPIPGVTSRVATDLTISNVPGHGLCQEYDCDQGEYEVHYDIDCSWGY